MKLEVKVPHLGESVSEAVVAEWLKQAGDYVRQDEVIGAVESEKATVEIIAEQAGVLSLKAKAGAKVAVGEVIAEIDTDAQAPAKTDDKKEELKKESAAGQLEVATTAGKKLKISPVAAKILKDAGLAATELKGSGLEGKITKDDALNAIKHVEKVDDKVTSQSPHHATVETAHANQQAPLNGRTSVRKPMTTLRKTISERLLAAKNSTAMLTTINEIDMLAIQELRAKYKECFQEKFGVSLGFVSLFTKACCLALQEFPVINARIDGDNIVYFNYCDISIAIATPRGLVVPVIRNAEKLDLAEIEKRIEELATKARENKLTIDEMTGGTFSITNGGVFGSLLSTPIINAPQSAILGMHTIQERPVVRDEQIVIRPMMYVSLSYDHRLIDGKESVQFLVRVKEVLEDPVRMLLNM
jgi:2-oxoglutarate dehydrogenase E2 component (dihydrolipoamide succinyltransferase)